MDIYLLYQERDMRKPLPPRISHAVSGLILNPAFFTDYLGGVGETVNILLLPELYLYAS